MAVAVIGHHPTLRKVRRMGRVRARQWAGNVYALARRVPVPPGVRSLLRERVAWRPGLRSVPVDSLLLGGQNHGSAAGFAGALDDPWWASTRVQDGPHADLLRRAGAGPLSDADLLGSAYGAMARAAIRLDGQYFDARDDDGILRGARAFLNDQRLHAVPEHPEQVGSARTPPGVPVDVAPIADSACYQVLDGHHRIARAAVAGQKNLEVRVRRVPVRTPLQELLGAMSWIGGEPELYQPVDAPEVATWPTARGCRDRWDKMRQLLAAEEVPIGSYLDVASCYGWFVAAARDHGFRAEGVEQDPSAPALGQLVHGLGPSDVHTGEAVTFLRGAGRQWDVVSCFSLVHHFVLGRSEDSAEDLVRALDAVARRVLFLDTGQAHERWFAESLAGWDTERVGEVLGQWTTFDRIVDLGPDEDDRGPYTGNYGRHLFACLRSEPG